MLHALVLVVSVVLEVVKCMITTISLSKGVLHAVCMITTISLSKGVLPAVFMITTISLSKEVLPAVCV